MCADDVVSVVLGRFDEIRARGLVAVLREDPRICVLGAGLDLDALELTPREHRPPVLIVDETAEHAVRLGAQSRRDLIGIPVPCRPQVEPPGG
jgi:hypothetical protein